MFDLSFFKKEGYQVLPQFLPQLLLDRIEEFLEREKQASITLLKDSFHVQTEEEVIQEIIHLGKEPEKLASTSHELRMMMSGHFSLKARLAPILHDIPKHGSVNTLFDQIFPDQSPRVHLPPTARFILPGNTFAAVPPHQDISYNEHVEDFFVMWVPFCQIDDFRGGVAVYKGTNQKEKIQVGKDNFWLSGISGLENYQKIHLTMQRGDVLLLNPWIVHTSMPNLSKNTRISVDYRFFFGPSKKHCLDLITHQVIEPEPVLAPA